MVFRGNTSTLLRSGAPYYNILPWPEPSKRAKFKIIETHLVTMNARPLEGPSTCLVASMVVSTRDMSSDCGFNKLSQKTHK